MLLTLLLIPVNRLCPVPLGIVTKHHLDYLPLAKIVLLHESVNHTTAVFRHASAHPRLLLVFPHFWSVHRHYPLWQDMLNIGAKRLRFLQQFRYNQVTLPVSCREFVAGLFATVGLPCKGQRPAPEERRLPFFGGCPFLEVFYEEFTGSRTIRRSHSRGAGAGKGHRFGDGVGAGTGAMRSGARDLATHGR